MPSHYVYACNACGKAELRYRNAQRSRCCHATMTRREPPSELEQLRLEINRLRLQMQRLELENADLLCRTTQAEQNAVFYRGA